MVPLKHELLPPVPTVSPHQVGEYTHAWCAILWHVVSGACSRVVGQCVFAFSATEQACPAHTEFTGYAVGIRAGAGARFGDVLISDKQNGHWRFY